VITSGPTRQDPAREFFYQKADLAWRMLKVNGTLESRAEPPQLRYMWPLTIGGTWEQTVTVYEMWYSPEVKHWVRSGPSIRGA